MIYLDNAATTLQKPQEVTDAVLCAMRSMGNSGRGVNEASLTAASVIFDTRALLADFFHAEDVSRIAFTSNATEALNIAIKGLFNANDHVITTVLEHNSVLRPLYEIQEQGTEVTFLPCDAAGMPDYDSFEAAIQANTKALLCTHASNVTGNLLDIKRIGNIARRHGLLFIVDASQTAGVFDIDVQAMNIDILCFTGHKGMLGPQGTGGIYVRTGIDLRPLKSGGSGVQTYSRTHPAQMPTHLEAGTLNGHGIAGLGGAVCYLNKTGLGTIRAREQSLMRRFYNGIKDLPNITIYGDFTQKERCPIVSLNINDYDSAIIGDELYNSYDSAIRSGGHCAPLMHQALGTKSSGMVRFSFSHFNKEEEIDMAIKAIKELAQ